ncbi:PEP-CTERM sorting domain-containing protein [Roseateles sp.]|uniref:beta strand repeat-containing protein n=1 Tax=Roseateles sp. TaxID=1971397 RepID=UPI0039E94AA9
MHAYPLIAPARAGRRHPADLRLRALSAAALLAMAGLPQLASSAPCTFTAGNYSGSGCATTLLSGDTLSISPGGYKYLDLLLTAQAGAVIDATDSLYFVGGNTLNNAGAFRFGSDASLYDNGTSGVLVNTGTLSKIGGTGDSTINISGFVSNGGNVNAQTGRIVFNSSGSFNAGSSFTGPGQVLIAGGASFAGSFSSDGSLVLAGGTYTGNAGTPARLASGTVQWMSGSMAGQWQTASGSTVNVLGGGYKYVAGAITNGGAMAATDNLYFNDGQTLTNTGAYRFDNDAGLVSNGGANYFVNNGVLVKAGGTGDSTIGINGFTNGAGGIIDAQTGRIVFNNGAVLNDGSVIAGAGQVSITNGATFSGALSTANNLYLSGGTFNANNVVATGDVHWTSGTLAGTWQTASGSTLHVAGGGYKYVGGSLTNAGTMTAVDSLYFNDGTSLVNNGRYEFANDAALYANGGSNSFVNNGTLAKVGGSGDSYVTVTSFTNATGGIVDVQTGRIVFNRAPTFASGSVITGAGQVAIVDGATFNGALATANNLYLAGGTVTANNVTATGDVHWTSGTLAGTWQTASGSTLHVAGGGYKYVGGTLTNAGTMTAVDSLYFNDGTSLVNNGRYEFANDAALYANGGSNSFVNNGTLAKVGGSGDSYVTVTSFTNATGGIVDVQTGRIVFNRAPTFASGSVITGAGQVAIVDGATFNGALATANNLYLAGGTVTANNVTATGDVHWTSGTLAGTWQTASGSTLHVAGGGYKYVGGSLTNAGTMTAVDSLYFNDGTSLVNNGRYEFANDAALYANGGSNSFVNNGTLAKVGGTGDSYVTVNGFTNGAGGVVDAQAGRIVFNGSPVFQSGSAVTGAGQVVVVSGATFSGALSTAGNLYLSGSGTVTANNVVATGGAHWTSGTMAGQWQSSGGALSVEGGGYKYASGLALSGRTLATDALYVYGAGALSNNGRYEFANDAGIYGGGEVINNGRIVKTGGTGTSDLSNTALQNAGTLESQIGTLRLPDNFVNTGTLMGVASIQVDGMLTNNGHIAPGAAASTGTLTLQGNLQQGAMGVLDIRLTSASLSDMLQVNGTAGIGGSTLALSCFACVLNDGESYLLMSSTGPLNGVFGSVTTVGFGVGFQYAIDYSHTNQVWLNVLEVGAVPEPSTYAMLLAGVGVIGWLVRRRKAIA